MALSKRSAAVDLMSKTVALALTFKGIGNRRKVNTSQVEVDADKEWIAVSKRLIEAEELDAIVHLDGEIKHYIDTRALPSLFKRGVYLLPLALVAEVNEKLTEYSKDRTKLVERLAKVYNKHVNEAEERLRGVFQRTDYVSTIQLRAAFALCWQFTSFNTPASLNQISKELYEAEKAKAESQWSDARETIQQLLRANMSEMVSHLVEKLTPGEDGKKKIFRDTAVGKLQEFLGTFDLRNVTDDAQLSALVEKAKKLVDGVDPKNLRDNEATRDFVREGFAKIKASLDPMITVKPKRAISFDEEAA